MKKFNVLLVILISISLISFAKRDIDAWKSEKSLDQQFNVFKKNLNYWSDFYSLTEPQLNQFYKAFSDTISVLKEEVEESKHKIKVLQNELNSKIAETKEIQLKLNRSIQLENSISVFGLDVNKSIYTLTMSLVILAFLALSGIVFIMFYRSNKITQRTKKDYTELKEEYEIHKKNALDRYVKMNIELNKTRFELNKR